MKRAWARCTAWFRSGEGGRQLSGYAVIGTLQLLIDWAIYVALTAFGVPISAANPIARALGAILGYVGNGAYTFRQRGNPHRLGRASLVKFIVLWLLLTVASTLALKSIASFAGMGWAWLLKPVADLGLAFIAFLASRLWVYR